MFSEGFTSALRRKNKVMLLVRLKEGSKKIIFQLDFESVLYILIFLSLARMISHFSTHQFIMLFSSISAFAVTLLVGAKLAKSILRRSATVDIAKNSKAAFIGFTPLLGTFFVYIIWMITATFSHLAPVVVPISVFLCVLLPPKLRITSSLFKKIKQFSIELRDKKRCGILFIVQSVTMFFVSGELVRLGVKSSASIFDSLSDLFISLIAIVFVITLVLSLSETKLSFIAVATTGLWMRSFLLLRGFVSSAWDTANHLSVTKFLVQGGVTPLIAPHITWRFGSRLTLYFHANLAFLSELIGASPDLIAGAMSVTIFTIPLLVGSYALCSIAFKDRLARQLGFVFIVLLQIMMWRYIELAPRNLSWALFPSYVAVLVSCAERSPILVVISTLIITLPHPVGIVLAIPSFVGALIISKSMQDFLRRYFKPLMIIAVPTVFLLINYHTRDMFLRALSYDIQFRGFPIGISSEHLTLNLLSSLIQSPLQVLSNSLMRDFLYLLGGFAVAPWILWKKSIGNKKLRAITIVGGMLFAGYVFMDFFFVGPRGSIWYLIPPISSVICLNISFLLFHLIKWQIK